MTRSGTSIPRAVLTRGLDRSGVDPGGASPHDGAIRSHTCDLCSMRAEDLKEAAEDRLAQRWPAPED